MSRRIDTGEAGSAGGTHGSAGPGRPLLLGKMGGEDYLGRLAKYIPTEIVGLYLATSGMIPSATKGEPRWLALWVVFLLSFALVPVYLFFVTTRGTKRPLWPQIVLGSVAFPVWVFAIGGPFKYFSWYEGWIASITLAFVTVAFGFYRPRPGS